MLAVAAAVRFVAVPTVAVVGAVTEIVGNAARAVTETAVERT